MNEHDSQIISSLLENIGFKPASKQQLDDGQISVWVINTCSVREKASTRLYGQLGQLAELKRVNPYLKIVVAGCQAQADKALVLQKAPWVDIVLGTFDIKKLPQLLHENKSPAPAPLANHITKLDENEIKQRLATSDKFTGFISDILYQTKTANNNFSFPAGIEKKPVTRPNCLTVPSSPRLSGPSAWVTISVGCSNRCSFCIVPYTRGNAHDRQKSDILNECQTLAKQGCKEITLLGQNVNSFGYHGDFSENDNDNEKLVNHLDKPLVANNRRQNRFAFGQLLQDVCKIDGIERVRFMSPHPAYFNDELIRVIGSNDKIMPCVHLPLQSGSDRILQKMARGYDTKRFYKIVQDLRRAKPDIYLTTDIIIGFPGENDDDFEATYEFLEKVRFDSAYIFNYSRRPHTKAADLVDQVPPNIMTQRFNKLLAMQEKISEEKAKDSEGKVFECLITDLSQARPKNNENIKITGRSKDNRLIHIDFSKQDPSMVNAIKLGDFVPVYITHAAPHHLLGKLA